MSKRQKRRLIATTLIVILLIITIERIYNSRDEFNVVAEDACHYGILEAKLEMKHKLNDFEYMYDIFEKNYPFFKVNERLHGVDWLGNKSKYKRMIRNTKNDAEFFLAIETILSDLNNNHVNIFNGKNYWYMRDEYERSYSRPSIQKYIHLYEAFVNPSVAYRYMASSKEFDMEKESALETKVLIEDEAAYMKIKMMASFDVQKEDYDKAKEFLKSRENYEKLIIDIRGNGGGSNDYWKNIVGLLANEHLSVHYYSFYKDGHRKGVLEPYKVSGLTTIKDLDKETLNQFPEEVKTDFDFYKMNSIHIVPWEESMDPLENINFKGEIYLLVDEGVFSASESFASFAKDSGFATLVGQPTGGDRVFAEIPIIHLPQTKFVIRYSRELGINADNTINMETKTVPHIQVDPTCHEDFNQDKCIQAVIRD